MMRPRNGRRLAKRVFTHGNVAIEYALVLPALLAFVFGLIDTGRAIWTQTTLDRAMQAAARCAAVDVVQCGTASQVQAYAATQAYGMTIISSAVTVASQSCGIQVATTFPFDPIVPWFGSGIITLQAQACYPLNVV